MARSKSRERPSTRVETLDESLRFRRAQIDRWFQQRQYDLTPPLYRNQVELPLTPRTILQPKVARQIKRLIKTSAKLSPKDARNRINPLLAKALSQQFGATNVLKARACARRNQRRQVIHALKLTGKGAKSKRTRSISSKYKCR